MTAFGTLPFDAQLARIAALVQTGEDPRALLREAGALADAEPLARLLELLAAHGQLEALPERELGAIFEALPDAALQHLLSRESADAIGARLERLAADALRRWPLPRLGALAFVARWLRRRAPAAHQRVVAEADAMLEGEPSEHAGRWLLFASGERLAALASDDRWSALVRETTTAAIDALARAPKSISQANAERILAQRVYADPGHFFFELLQNADDAGATRWSVSIDAGAVTVRHDGAPFSFLDLVGVLSIGQTTKHADQIGFFGVGFKSVYEVCERPRVHSGVFDFEIAHVSIPRALAARPPHAPGETVLVLPLEERADAALLRSRALAIPPETLMTLRRVRTLEVIGDGTRSAWTLDREGANAVLHRGEERRAHRIASRTLRFEGPREEGRARESDVVIAVSLDAGGAPIPQRGPTLYAFLPTAERSGLRVMVHARFDVTLDRERLVLGSPWNDALLVAAGAALADVIARLAHEGHDVLPVLSSPEELAPQVAPWIDALRAGLLDTPCLPGAARETLSPARARVLDEPLSRALAGVDLGDGDRALAVLPSRERAVAIALGARAFGADELVRFLETRLVAGAPPPPWLGGAVIDALAAATIDDDALRAIPLLVLDAPDGAPGQRLVAARDAYAASAAWASLYAEVRPVVAFERVPDVLRARLAIRPLEFSQLAIDLRDDVLRARLVAKGDRLYDVLEGASQEQLAELGDLPLLPAFDSRARPARELVVLDAMLAPLAGMLASRLAVLDPTFARRREALASRWIARCGLPELVTRMESGLVLGAGAHAALRVLLDAHAPALARDLARRIAALPLFADRHGVMRPLSGPRRALRGPADLTARLPEWPWLDAAENDSFVAASETAIVDARALASALAAPDRELPAVPPDRLASTTEWLAQRAGELPSTVAHRLGEVPIWIDVEGVARPLDVLRRGTPSAALDSFHALTSERSIASAGALRLAAALGLEGRLASSDHAAWVADRLRSDAVPPVPRALLAAILAEISTVLPAHAVAPLAGLPMFADETGHRRALASWSAPDVRACHRAGPFLALLRGGPWPLLAEEDEALFATFLAHAAPPPATTADVLRHAGALVASPDALVAFLDDHADSVDPATRSVLAELAIFPSGTGARHAAGALGARAPWIDALGARALASLDLESALVATIQDEARIARLGLALRPTRVLLEERVLPAILEGVSLRDQRAPWNDVTAIGALAVLATRSGVDLRGVPLAIDLAERAVHGPLHHATDVERALVSALPLSARLAHRTWADAHASAVPASPLLEPLSPRRIAEALRDACREEAPREAHPILRDQDALYVWLRESGPVIASDDAARAALGSAAVFPSQRGTLRAARELVLDPALPDLGLGWGLASDVPADVARWLRATYELDRHARRALVAQLLDGLDVAASDDDRARAEKLTGFLARTLGAGEITSDELEERTRRLDVRARLKVPLVGGGWEKPRFAWSPSDDIASHADAFALDLPPRVALGALDASSRLLLAACGAKDDLDDGTITACLDGRGLREGPAARRALARYVALRALAVPARIDRWRLATRSWLPSVEGELRRPRDLLWPDALARALFGETSTRFPDPEVIFELDDRAANRLGVARADALSVADVARHVDDRDASAPLLAWLEEALTAKRISASEVRLAFRDRILLRDDEGTPRPAPHLARSGARALFGSRRGDWTASSDFPRVASALDIPKEPSPGMIADFLIEVGAASHEIEARERESLLTRLPDCLERYDREAGAQQHLPPGAAIAALRGGVRILARIGAPGLRLLSPAVLAETIEPDVLDAFADPMPVDRGTSLERRLLASGVPDLWSGFEVRTVMPGPREDTLDGEAERLRAALAPLMGSSIGARARAHHALAVRGSLVVTPDADARRAPRRTEITVPVDAWIDDGVLLVTAAVLDDPARLAPALARDPIRRAAIAAWLDEGRDEGRWRRAPDREEAAPLVAESAGMFARLRRFFAGDPPAAPPAPAQAAARSSAKPRASQPRSERDASFFSPSAALDPQLERTDGWMDARREAPDFGFAFSPPRLESPWLYAPKLVVSRFDRRGQRWAATPLARPTPRGDAGTIVMRGRLPAGESILPLPLYGRVAEIRIGRGDVQAHTGASGAVAVRLDEATDVRLRIALGRLPDLDRARPMRDAPDALVTFVPDDELPDEVHAAIAAHENDDDAPIVRALALRDFVRERYRYDPTYLEDASVGRWLARVTQGRANVHVAALHAASDATFLGAGVCYELNVLACELLRRAGIPAVLATGWVVDGGALSEPDHLWAIALLEDDAGAPIWVPIDASTTREGRPLRVPRRPPGRFRAPRDPLAKAPQPARWDLGQGERAGSAVRSAASRGSDRIKRKKSPPRAELARVLHHLGLLAGRPLDETERAAVERALSDPRAAASLLDRLRER